MINGMPPMTTPSHTSSHRAAWTVLVALVVVILVGTGSWFAFTREAPAAARVALVAPSDTLARAPIGVRVRVRVVNTTAVQGLARRATAVLREFGYDVVDFETGTVAPRATVIIVHTGHPDWAARVQRALGVGVIETQTDSSRVVDLSVFVGRDWQPPSLPLRP